MAQTLKLWSSDKRYHAVYWIYTDVSEKLFTYGENIKSHLVNLAEGEGVSLCYVSSYRTME